MMRYRVTCLTPTLVGDGQRLAPIDYMVWKEHVNVLDQKRIFRLLAKGPRLDGYLAQLKKSDKLDFASWGGFAQNFAGRRIPFEFPGAAVFWDRTRAEHLFIPTFASGPAGPYLPATSIKGALRTGAVFARWTEGLLRDLASRLKDERSMRRPALKAEESVLGGSGSSRVKAVSAGDSAAVPFSVMKVYLLRVATLVPRGPGKYELGWKMAPRGNVDGRRPDESTPIFAEMAVPGAVFEGPWQERTPVQRGRETADRATLFAAANKYAAELLARHKEYAGMAGLAALAQSIGQLEARLSEIRERYDACVLSIGWGSGLLGKSAYLNTQDETYRQILKQFPLYARAIQTGLPFPKTRRIIFAGNQPSTLPGWVLLEVA